jgi:MFS family permease
MGILEGAQGFGLFLGPAIGSTIYAFFGYDWTFYSFGIFNISLAFILYFLFPEEQPKVLNQPNLDPLLTPLQEEHLLSAQKSTKVTYYSLMGKPRFFFATLASCLAYVNFAYFEPSMPLRLKDDFYLSTE